MRPVFIALALVAHGATLHAAPPFDVAYRAWDAVTDIAKHNGDPALAGECGKTFRPFVIPGLKRQTPQEQDVAATACEAAARAVCANEKLRKTPETIGKCREFR